MTLKTELAVDSPDPAPAPSADADRAPAAALRYRVGIADLDAHRFRVALTIAEPHARQQLMLPVWIPGSYLVREFSKHLLRLSARQGKRALPVRQLDKHRWEVDANPAKPLQLGWEVIAFDKSVRAAWLDRERGFFNGTSLLLAAVGHEQLPHELELSADGAPADWRAATALAPVEIDAAGFGRYRAAGYDELVDGPVELGNFWSGDFKVRGVPHRFVVAGAAPSFDPARLLADAHKICAAEIDFWHPARAGRPPFQHYLFLLNAVADGYGGLEHRASTALIAKRSDLPRLGDPAPATTAATAAAATALATRVAAAPQPPDGDPSPDAAMRRTLQAVRSAAAEAAAHPARPEGYVTLLGLISHEYFHAWNVKRLRPAEFERFDYARENFTELLWFFEGFTSYYDDLLLRRAGLIGDVQYLKLLGKTINQLRQTPGRLVQSVAQASFDAWVKFYRPDETTPNTTVSYYGKGALVALCFDLTLRAERDDATLDDVLRLLWSRCAAGPMREADFAAALEQIGGRSYAREIAAWVHGTDELPLRELLETHGVKVHEEPSQPAQRLGLRVTEDSGTIVVGMVLAGGAAERAGFAAGDEWLGIEAAAGTATATAGAAATRSSGWRLRKLDELALYAGAEARDLTALVARDQRLLRLPLKLPRHDLTWRLALEDAARARPWLYGR